MRSILAGLRTLILPWGSQPNDPAIILGPDLPPCMQARYSSAVFYRPPGTVGAGIAGRPYQYRAQVGTATLAVGTNLVEEGWLVYDSSGAVCGFIVYATYGATNDGSGSINASILLAGQNIGGGGVTTHALSLILGNGVRQFNMSLGAAGNDPNLSGFTVDGKAFPRGLIDAVASTGSSAATAAEIVSLTGNTVTFYDGHVFAVKLSGQVLTSVANQAAFLSLRRTSLAGTLLGITGTPAIFTTVANHYEIVFMIRNVSGADITDNLVSTISRAAGAGTVQDFGSGGTQLRRMEVWDVGEFPAWPSIIPQI